MAERPDKEAALLASWLAETPEDELFQRAMLRLARGVAADPAPAAGEEAEAAGDGKTTL